MSTESVVPHKNSNTVWLVASVVVVVLLVGGLAALYAGGRYMIFPAMEAAYQRKDCPAIENAAGWMQTLYPGALEATANALRSLNECRAYDDARAKEQSADWQAASAAFHAYAETYPNGILVREAHIGEANALLELATQKVDARQFEAALPTLQAIVSGFGDTPAAKNANALMPQLLTDWANSLREGKAFDDALAKYKELDAWARANANQNAVLTAKSETAQTYLVWGLSEQAAKRFDEARKRFGQAIEADPQPQASNGPRVRAESALAELEKLWGDSLWAEGKFDAAIERYRAYHGNTPEGKDFLSQKYLDWAATFTKEEKYDEALLKMQQAESEASETMKATVAQARADLFETFAHSKTGAAQKAMAEIGAQICEKQKPHKYPIFALAPEKKLFAAFGIETRLPDTLRASVPAETHYVVCVTIETSAVQTVRFPIVINGYLVYNEAQGWFGQMVREQITWRISVRRADSGEEVAAKAFVGGTPPPLPDINRSNVVDILTGGQYQRYRGDDPNMSDVAAWLETLLK